MTFGVYLCKNIFFALKNLKYYAEFDIIFFIISIIFFMEDI